MRKSKVVLSFDDGRMDNYQIAFEELLPRQLGATFSITSGYIEKSISNVGLCENNPMTVNNVIELSKYSLFEIAGHGYAHLNTLEDWEKGVSLLKEWLGERYFKNGYGIASPHSFVDYCWVNENREKCERQNIRYIRTGLVNQKQVLQRFVSKCARMTRSQRLAFFPVRSSFTSIEKGQYLYYSFPILHQHSPNQILYLIEKAVQNNADIIFMLHSILKPREEYYDDMFSWDYQSFIALCNYLVKMRDLGVLEIVRNIDLVQEEL